MSNTCPVHRILNQTFSVSEMAYLLREREALHICDSCFFHFQYRLAKTGAPEGKIRLTQIGPAYKEDK